MKEGQINLEQFGLNEVVERVDLEPNGEVLGSVVELTAGKARGKEVYTIMK